MKAADTTRADMVRRAGNRCEYCGMSQVEQEAQFHPCHIVPVHEGGNDSQDNMALACVSCSFRKGDRRVAVDPLTGKTVPLFHPRLQAWGEHFEWKAIRVAGRSATGRATMQLLKMNRVLAQSLREEEQLRGRHPPPVRKR